MILIRYTLLSAYYVDGIINCFTLGIGKKQQMGNLRLWEAYALFLIDLARKEIFHYCLAQMTMWSTG